MESHLHKWYYFNYILPHLQQNTRILMLDLKEQKSLE